VKITEEKVRYVADLANLRLTDAEVAKLQIDLEEILEHMDQLIQVNTDGVEPMAQVLTDDQTADATLREDIELPCGIAAEVLKQAPDPEPPLFRVPKVIER